MKNNFKNLDKDTRSLVMRLFVLIEEIDLMEDEHPHETRFADVQICIDVLRDRVDDIKKQLKERKN